MFVFSAASDCSGWYCTNDYVGDSNSCTNWNSSENSARNNSNLHCCHSKTLSAFRTFFCSFSYACVDACTYVHMYAYTHVHINTDQSGD